MLGAVPVLRGAGVAKQLSPGGTLVVGRAPDCDIVVASRSVSGRHAAIELISTGDAVIHDLNSLNGTFVNDARLKGQRVALSDGDTLRFGYDPSTYRYEAAARDHNAASPVPESPPLQDPRHVAAAGRPPPPPRNEWLPRAELASADGVAVVTSTSGMRAPQSRPPPADPWTPQQNGAGNGEPARYGGDGRGERPMSAADAERVDIQLAAEMNQQPPLLGNHHQPQTASQQQHSQPTNQQQERPHQSDHDYHSQQQRAATADCLTGQVIGGLQHHHDSADPVSDSRHAAAPF